MDFKPQLHTISIAWRKLDITPIGEFEPGSLAN
jgi:hypothetical protein